MSPLLLILLIAVAVVAYWLIKQRDDKTTSQRSYDDSADNAPQLPNTNEIARDALTRVSNACEAAGGDAYSSLIIAASSDGKISRDELRVAMWFCEGCGAQFSADDVAYVSKLNSGVKMTASSSRTAAQLAAECHNMPLSVLLRLYAAHATIGKPWNKTARRSRETLSALEILIDRKMNQPAEVVHNNSLKS